MKVGITGSRTGPTLAQLTVVTRELAAWVGDELHHGDCVGVDATVAAVASGLGYRTVAHPPQLLLYRAGHASDEVRSAQEYLARDRAIVDEVDVLLACPDGPERLHSGTWYTIRYARKIGRRVILIQPDGGIVETMEGVA